MVVADFLALESPDVRRLAEMLDPLSLTDFRNANQLSLNDHITCVQIHSQLNETVGFLLLSPLEKCTGELAPASPALSGRCLGFRISER